MQTVFRCAIAGFVSVGTSIALAQPTLTAIIPRTLVPGVTTQVTVTGTNLVDPLQVWTSFQATVEVVPITGDAKTPGSRTLKVTPAGDSALSLGGIFVGTPAGATNVKLMILDELPNQHDSGKNHSFESAQTIPDRCAVEGMTDSAASDFYRIAVKKGQRLAVEVYASRIQSVVDPYLRLLDAAGTELATADDDAGLGSESRLSWIVSEDSEAVVEIRDSQYRAAGQYIMRVGDFPLITSPYPLGVRIGSTVGLHFAGPDQDSTPRFVHVADCMGTMPVAVQIADGQSRAFSEVVVSPFPEFVESEPNGDFPQATNLVAPCAVNGRFDASDDRDCYRFAALKGQAIRFETTSRSAGSPAMVLLKVDDATGTTLKETAVNDQDEWSIDFTPPADGVYYLSAEDLLHRGGGDYTYRVTAKLDGDFRLAIKHGETTKLQLASPQNAGFTIPVECIRHGYTGPVQLELISAGSTGTPLPLRMVNGIIPADVAEHRLLIETTAGSSAGLHGLRIVGHAVGSDPTTCPRHAPHIATTRTTLRTLHPQTPYPHSSIDGLLAVSVGAPTERFFELQPTVTSAQFNLEKGEVQFDATIKRKNAEFKDAVFVVVDNLPERFSAIVKQDDDVYDITVKGPRESAGSFVARILGYGQFKGRGQIARQTVNIEVKR